jgi:hypothetical protein
MTSWIERTLQALRSLLGWNDISELRLTPAHGWLLVRRPVAVTVSPSVPPAPARPSSGSGWRG